MERIVADSALLTDSATTTVPARPRVWTRAFVLLCVAGFLGSASSSLLTPVLPLFIQQQGGTAIFVGVVVAAFSAPSVVLRPFMGRLVDTWSTRGVLGLSALAMGLAGFGYLVYQTVVLLVVRAVHGVAWAGYNTSANVLVARIAPPERRGEAVGYYVTAQGVAYAAMPATALWLLGWIGFGGIFLIAAASGLLVAATALGMPGQAPAPVPRTSEGFWRSLVERDALLPCALDFLTKLPHAATNVFIPLYATFRGIPIELLLIYFLAYGVAGLVTRGWLGGWSDRIGRGWAIALGTTTSVVALLLMSQAADIVTLTLAGVLFGFGQSAAAPAVMALAIDRSRPERRGAAMATYSLAFQLASGGGGLVWGVLIETLGYREMYLAAALAPLLGLLLLIRYWGMTTAEPYRGV
jgi:MFS family permease